MKILQRKKGDTLRRRLWLYYAGTKDPVDLSDCTAYSQMRADVDGDVLLDATVTIDPTNGLVTALYTADQMDSLDTGIYGFDIRIVSEGDVKTLYEEQFRIKKSYTDIEE